MTRSNLQHISLKKNVMMAVTDVKGGGIHKECLMKEENIRGRDVPHCNLKLHHQPEQ